MKAYLPKYLLFSALIAGGMVSTHFIELFQETLLFNWASFAVFFLATWGIMHFALASIAANDNKKFFMVFMAGIGGKLLITMMLVLICVEIYDPENTLVITPFLLMYFAFLVFETIYLVKASRKNS